MSKQNKLPPVKPSPPPKGQWSKAISQWTRRIKPPKVGPPKIGGRR